MIFGVEETYCSPVIQANNNDLVIRDIPEFTFKGILNNSINPAKFVNAHIYNFNNPMCVLINGKVVKSVEHVSFNSFILDNKYGLPETLTNLYKSYNEIKKYFFDTYPDASDGNRQYFINGLKMMICIIFIKN